jgi:transposase
MTQTEYAETQPLMTIHGVGYITALTFVLTLGDKERFGRSRDVGCYLSARLAPLPIWTRNYPDGISMTSESLDQHLNLN